ncbi:hypothetical protein [Aeromicrobium sp. 9AM]|uniref:hypothetical protein n=1 Tax=Aeromicrobium sp. 9AM TaxID=2653126 RepID=UPI0012F23F96|nr:hypothetical protein [Aeromicrobium sp. 9AM]VXC09178.1 conserved hypothetical protein [Aeromicrobium sp. 9AM]
MILAADTNVVVSTPGIPNFVTSTPHVPNVVIAPVVGPPGAAGGAFRFTQTVPASTWTIAHNLGRYPVFNLFPADSPNTPVFTDVTYPDDNTAVVEWPTAVSGRAEA